MTSDGVNSYTWDRANRLLTWNNGVAADLVNHTYDGEGRRVLQAVGTTSPTITKYLLDIQPGLAVVLSQTEGSDVTRFVHAPRGIHARQDASNDWHWTGQDGLGTVRVETDNSVALEGSQNLDPFGNLIDLNGTIGTPYGFTGELVDGSGLLDLRARRYNAALGTFASLDPFEGMPDRAMSLNGYSWVEGNSINRTDPTGHVICSDVYGNGSQNDPNGKFATCFNQVRTLRDSYGIRLKSETTNGVNDWTSTRVKNVYDAVIAINAKLSSATQNAIGNTEMILVGASPDSGAARASTCSRIRLFLSYNRGGVSYTDTKHTVANIVHEFGHIFTQFRNTAPQDMWRAISQAKTGAQPPTSNSDNQNAGIDGRKGWDFELRENKGDDTNLVGEQVPDMFMFWVLGYSFSDDEYGQIREDYVNGGPVRNLLSRPVDGDNPLVSSGMRQWAEAAIPCSSQSAAIFSDVLFVQQQLSNGICGDVGDILSGLTTL